MSANYANALNLAYWVYKVHPELFAQLQQRALASARSATNVQRLAALGQDGADIGTTTFFDTGSDPTFTIDTSSFDSSLASSITPDLTSLSTPDLTNISFDSSGLAVPTFSTAADAITPSSATTGGFSLSSALSSVGNFLSSTAGLTSLASLGTAYYKANTPQAQTVSTQVARVANGYAPAPITYGSYNGQVTPVLQQPGRAGVALTPASLQALVPSSLQPYLIPVTVGGLLLWALSRARTRR